MSYTMRNNFILGSLTAAVLLVGGYYVLWFFPGKIAERKKELTEVHNQLKQYENIEGEFFQLDSMIREKRQRLTTLEKQFTSEETFAQTYDYLNSILGQIGFLEFNMNFVRKEDRGKYGYNVYSIRGEGAFSRVFQFIYYIEKGPRMYRISRLSLSSAERSGPNSRNPAQVIPFDMEVWSYFAKLDSLPAVTERLASLSAPQVANPFQLAVARPVAVSSLPPNTEKLVEVGRAELKAVMAGKALIEYNGQVHVMKEGDRVYLGQLTHINPDKNEVVFTLNKNGVSETVTLQLKFGGGK